MAGRRSLIALTAGLFAVAPLSTLALEFPDADRQLIPYIDNRSTPQDVLTSFYNAINTGQFPRAYGYYASDYAPKDFDAWVKGYTSTVRVRLVTGSALPSPGAGQIYWSVPLAIEATLSDGSKRVYGGCYQLHMANPGMITAPPYSPIAMQKGKLEPSDKPLEQAVPEKCGPVL
ncbi:hypothetical protein [Polycladidibacter hongkongensis]|uniref:hypothetical protein n=1 Tax=Polycladidibacter hongkongensis TaxID=1647556 RepID=UPI00082EC008|nr:hypothetical protein [Pseudovibrio hongkongensis]